MLFVSRNQLNQVVEREVEYAVAQVRHDLSQEIEEKERQLKQCLEGLENVRRSEREWRELAATNSSSYWRLLCDYGAVITFEKREYYSTTRTVVVDYRPHVKLDKLDGRFFGSSGWNEEEAILDKLLKSLTPEEWSYSRENRPCHICKHYGAESVSLQRICNDIKEANAWIKKCIEDALHAKEIQDIIK
jgi:hypothetical protein